MDCSGIFLIRSYFRASITILLLFLFSTAADAELVLTSPPRESAADGQKQYGTLAKVLTEVLGEKVTYQQPKGWLFYQRDMRADQYDIIFDGPHFISWRMHQFDHIPVAKLPGKLGFIVIGSKHEKEISGLEDLINVRICGIAPPNLSTLTVLAQFENPVRQPRLITPKGGMAGVYKAFKNGKCKAAILRDKFFEKKVSQQEREGLNILYKSIPAANQGISLSSRVSAEQRRLITEVLTQVSAGTAPTLKRFAPKADNLIPASKNDYADYYKLLTGVIFGWEITNPGFVKAE